MEVVKNNSLIVENKSLDEKNENRENITINLKKMSGDMISITYDFYNENNENNETLEGIINRDIMTNYKGYYFSIFKEGEELENSKNLKNGDILDFFIFPKKIEVCLFFIEESLMYKDEKDSTAFDRGEFYKKFDISVIEEYIKKKIFIDMYEYTFYTRKGVYIPSESIKVINEDSYDDEEHIIVIEEKPIFFDIKSLICFIFKSKFEDNILQYITDYLLEKFEL